MRVRARDPELVHEPCPEAHAVLDVATDHDADALVALLENEIVPLFYDRDDNGVPRGWLERARRSLTTIPGRFNTHRMVGEYVESAYI